MKRHVRGISLVEVLVVTAIVAVLSAIIWLFLGPRTKVSAMERAVGADLSQLVVATHLYMADHDGEYPNWPRDLAPRTPLKMRTFIGFENTDENSLKEGDIRRIGDEYYLAYHCFARRADAVRTPVHPWDENKWWLWSAPLEKIGPRRTMELFGNCFKPPVYMPQRSVLHYVAYLDGRVKWANRADNLWIEENTMCVTQGVGR